MRILIQRVKSASVTIGGQLRSQIGAGLLVLLGVGADDTDEDVEYLAGKLVRLRIFDDAQGVMNLDVRQVGGQVLVVSQFTLLASTRKGNRPLRGACRGALGAGGDDGRIRRRHAGGAGERRPGNHLDRFENEGLLTKK